MSPPSVLQRFDGLATSISDLRGLIREASGGLISERVPEHGSSQMMEFTDDGAVEGAISLTPVRCNMG